VLFADGESRPEIYSAATVKDQAKICFSDAVKIVKTDPAGNIKPDKEKSTQKIDGIVAAIMALDEWMTAQANDESNPYENRGLLTL